MSAKVRCLICPKGCELAVGEMGDCRVRQNLDGVICGTTYGQPCSIHVDPVEKKPLYHFLPGSPILSMGTSGCNLHCKSCQNWPISQSGKTGGQTVRPADVVEWAQEKGVPAVAYTYTEPLVSYEYTYDCCEAAAKAEIKNVLVTAAYIHPDPLRKICRYVDAANVDLKSFSDAFYREVCDAHLQPVLNALMIMKACGVMVEITNLLIPTLNDAEEETKQLCGWVVEHLGPETPLHFSRFFPQNQLQHLPPTPEETVLRAREIALETGLQFAYVGNMQSTTGENTYCPACGKLLIERRGFTVHQNRVEGGRCSGCHTPIYGVWL